MSYISSDTTNNILSTTLSLNILSLNLLITKVLIKLNIDTNTIGNIIILSIPLPIELIQIEKIIINKLINIPLLLFNLIPQLQALASSLNLE